ncbi:MAG: rRNA adenine N-6-methyltransferase family protein, partial [Bradymonadaceae bacterium]
MSDAESARSPGELLRAFQHRAKKQFGQHFLVDPSILGRIAEIAQIEPGARVLEIGPGCGTLTLSLLQRGATVRAAEIDRDAIAFLKEAL